MREKTTIEEERARIKGQEGRVREVYGDKQYPVMVQIVSVVTERGGLMHCIAGPKTFCECGQPRRICISIICGRHKYVLMELSACAVTYKTEPGAQRQLDVAGRQRWPHLRPSGDQRRRSVEPAPTPVWSVL